MADRLVVTASRGDFDATLIGSVTANTDPAPRPRVTLELPKHGKVEFLPTNRDAVLTVAGRPGGRHAGAAADRGRLLGAARRRPTT